MLSTGRPPARRLWPCQYVRRPRWPCERRERAVKQPRGRRPACCCRRSRTPRRPRRRSRARCRRRRNHARIMHDPVEGPPRFEVRQVLVSSAPGSMRAPPAASAPGRIRTCGTRFRKPMLYPLSYGGPMGCSIERAGGAGQVAVGTSTGRPAPTHAPNPPRRSPTRSWPADLRTDAAMDDRYPPAQ